jgi:proteasome accessory factor B
MMSRILPDDHCPRSLHTMKSNQGLVRSTRLAQIQHMLYRSPNGLTTREMASVCGVTMRTIQRDLLDLQAELGVPMTQEGDRYGILAGYVLPPVSFSLQEAMVLFLASRLLLRQTDEYNPHVQAALGKLLNVVPPGLGHRMAESLKGFETKAANPDFLQVFEQVAIAWATQRRLHITYQSLKSTEEKEWLIDPYFVEMTSVGYSTYVIGQAWREGREGITTFKLDRIKSIELLEDTLEIPEALNLDRLLGSSWGVMWGEETEVKLRFSLAVTRRVKESVWHPSQVLEDTPDGGCILTVRVGSTVEMTPWIRGWGPDVEVLEPEELRREFATWAAAFYRMYR